jgi:hypothetical protein
MQLTKIDLSAIVAIGHEDDYLALLLDRGDAMEYIEIPAPDVAFRGLQAVATLAEVGVPEFPECFDSITANYLLEAEDEA